MWTASRPCSTWLYLALPRAIQPDRVPTLATGTYYQALDQAPNRGDGPRTATTAPTTDAGMAVFDQVAVPAQHPIRADQQPQPAQRRPRQRHEQRGQQSRLLEPQTRPLIAKLSLQDRELVS
jgi:hypothetical protein